MTNWWEDFTSSASDSIGNIYYTLLYPITLLIGSGNNVVFNLTLDESSWFHDPMIIRIFKPFAVIS